MRATAASVRTTRPAVLEWNRFLAHVARGAEDIAAAWTLLHPDEEPAASRPDLDLLVIRDRETDETVAVQPCANSLRTGRFSSAGLFHLGELPVREGVRVEIGRPWLRHGWRNTQSLNALAHAVAWYAHRTRARWVFGPVQVRPEHRLDRIAFARWLVHRGARLPELGVRPHPSRTLPGLHGWILRDPLAAGEVARVERNLPPGLRLVLGLGARVHPFPAAHDDDEIVSYFMLIDRRDTHPSGSHAFDERSSARRR